MDLGLVLLLMGWLAAPPQPGEPSPQARGVPRTLLPVDEAAQVSFEVLARGPDGQTPEEWTSVTLSDGRSGYIHSRYVRSPIGYRAFFTKKDGSWRMVMLLSGD